MSEPSASPGKQSKRILVITLGPASGTSARLFQELTVMLSADHICRNLSIDMSGGSTAGRAFSVFAANLRHLRKVAWAQVVILHVPAALSLPLLLAARILGKKIIIFQWDVYPVTLSGQPYATSALRRLAHQAERFCLQLAHVISLPTEDFRGFSPARDPVIIPLWPQSEMPLQPVRAKTHKNREFHIAFAGQINALRGLDDCVAFLRSRSNDRIVLHLFSSDPFAVDLPAEASLRIEHHGHLAREPLQERLREMHFGLISLNPRMDQPGFPSKTYEYLAAGLPVLYFGRPLPAFVEMLQSSRVGVDITNMQHVDLGSIYQKLISELEQGRKDYLARCGLTGESLAALL